MVIYERYCKLPVWIRWLLFLPLSFIATTALAWSLRLIVQFNPIVEPPQIIVDLGFPVLCQSIFLGLVFYTVPKWKIGWVKSFFIFRTIFSIGYIILGVVGLLQGLKAASEWEYWKAGIAEAIVFLGSLYVMYELKDNNLTETEFRTMLAENSIQKDEIATV